ncbi:MAG: LysM peptidoglycan-binding domain-containing protein [Anaerolineales bacterium]|nr:LysM peptidoglycan-binding domain-containing protein [Anaerolineales bacterium]
MLKPNAARLRFVLTSLVGAGLLLAACTRSANPTNLPPTSTNGALGETPGAVSPGGENATMAAIGTEVASQLTATAVALSGAGGGDGEVPATETLPPVAGETQTPSADVLPSATQPPPPEGATPTTPPPAGAPCPNPYTVQQGDWLYKIARNCGVSVAALTAANPGINPNALKPGQLLNMPAQGTGATPEAGPGGGTGTGAGTATCTGTHTVITGDNLFRLAYACGLTIEQLAAANNIVYPYTIYPGQVLVYP